MKKIAAKLITISSQVLVVGLFLILLFSSGSKNSKTISVNNNNFNKMADSVSFLFKEDELFRKSTSLDQDDTVVVSLTDEDKEEKKDDNQDDKEIPATEEKKDEEAPENVTPEEPKTSPLDVDINSYPAIREVYGNLTGYGPDCYGCSGVTRSGYNLYDSIYYEDSEYGTVRILAADYSFGKNAIFRVSNVPGMDPFIGIVLDTGGNVGYGKGTLFDLAFATEKDPSIIGLTKNVKFELLREGVSW